MNSGHTGVQVETGHHPLGFTPGKNVVSEFRSNPQRLGGGE
jgi:hypothetical protein